jgi:4-amino-4-deoxy-L-arabinose transferase-like glycosyltransferase
MEQMAAARSRPTAPAAAALAAIAGVFLFTRIAMAERLPWFIDEGTHGRFTRDFAHHLDRAFESLTIAKEPLTIWIAAAFTKVGFAPLATTRVVSVVAGALTLAMVGLIARRLAGDGPALAAMALYALLPLFVVHDAIGIMDPLLTALMTSALYLQLELAARPRLRTALALAAVLGLGLLTKEGAKGAVLLLPLSLLCFDWSGPDVRRRLARWAGFAAIGVAGALAGWLLLRTSSLWDRAQAIREVPLLYPVRDVHDALADPWRWTRQNWPVYRDTLTGYVTLPIAAAALAGFGIMLRERPRPALVLAGWFAVLLVAALLLPISPYPRHALFVVPILLVFAGVGLARGAGELYRRIAALGPGGPGHGLSAGGSPGARVAAAVVTAAALALVVAPAAVRDVRIVDEPATAHYPGRDDVQYVTGVQAGTPWTEVRRLVRRETPPGEPVIRSHAAVEVLDLLLDGRNPFVFADRPAAARARLLIRDELPFPDTAGDRLLARGQFRLLARVHRPRGGAVVLVYERRAGAP